MLLASPPGQLHQPHSLCAFGPWFESSEITITEQLLTLQSKQLFGNIDHTDEHSTQSITSISSRLSNPQINWKKEPHYEQGSQGWQEQGPASTRPGQANITYHSTTGTHPVSCSSPELFEPPGQAPQAYQSKLNFKVLSVLIGSPKPLSLHC